MYGGSDGGNSTQKIYHEVVFACDWNSVLECHRRFVDKYEWFVLWLGETNRRAIYQELHDHLMHLQEEDEHAHTPIHFPAALDAERS